MFAAHSSACPSRVSAHVFRRCIALFLIPPTPTALRRSSLSEEFHRSAQWGRATELCPHRLAFRSIPLYWFVTWRKKNIDNWHHTHNTSAATMGRILSGYADGGRFCGAAFLFLNLMSFFFFFVYFHLIRSNFSVQFDFRIFNFFFFFEKE